MWPSTHCFLEGLLLETRQRWGQGLSSSPELQRWESRGPAAFPTTCPGTKPVSPAHSSTSGVRSAAAYPSPPPPPAPLRQSLGLGLAPCPLPSPTDPRKNAPAPAAAAPPSAPRHPHRAQPGPTHRYLPAHRADAPAVAALRLKGRLPAAAPATGRTRRRALVSSHWLPNLPPRRAAAADRYERLAAAGRQPLSSLVGGYIPAADWLKRCRGD